MVQQWDGDGVPVAESNCAEIGTEADKAARKKAAEMEPAWQSAGTEAGLLIWRIEAFNVVPWERQNYGKFCTGDSYIILETRKSANKDQEKLEHDIYFWLGEKTSIDEMGTAAYKTVELDDFLDGEPTQSREVMGRESQQFKSLFKDITYLDGGVESGFHCVGANTYCTKLFHVRKTKIGIISKEVACSRDSLNQGDCFVLDAGKKVYIWVGQHANPKEKFQARIIAEKIESERHGHAKATHDLDNEFWELLGGNGPIKPASKGTDEILAAEMGEGVLYCISDVSGSLTTKEVGRGTLKKSMLDSSNVMLLDHGTEICLWVGKGSSHVESHSAFRTAMNYLRTNNRDIKTPVHMYKEGNAIDNPVWRKIFMD